MNSTYMLDCVYVYSRQRETISKLELSWNSALNSSLACNSGEWTQIVEKQVV